MDKKLLPKISIITPVKNAAATFEKTIKSLIQQNYSNLEYIVIDGKSTDGTLDIIKKYENYISYWESDDDQNNVLAHIKGIKKANGDIIAFLNADDFYEPNILNLVGKEFNDDKSLDVVSSLYQIIKLDKDQNKYNIIHRSSTEEMLFDKNQVSQLFGMNARFFKKKLFDQYGLPIAIDNKNRNFISNDLEFMLRFLFNGAKNKVINNIAYNYLSHDQSITFSDNDLTKIRLYEDRIFIAKKFLSDNKLEIPKIWKKKFKKWIIKYRAIMVKFYIQNKDWVKFKEEFKKGVEDNGFLPFIFFFIKIMIRNSKYF